MNAKIMGEATNCPCGTELDSVRFFLNSKMQEVCEDCWRIEAAEDTEDE